MFNEKLKKAMTNANISQAQLVALTGISKSGISQYLAGKNKPGKAALTKLCLALDVKEEYFTLENYEDDNANTKYVNVPVTVAAKLMGKTPQCIRENLKNGRLPFGYALRGSGNRFTCYISPKLFTEFTGAKL
ncbi:MAG: helix-turn-helix domain-containing protein [bacterium]|nr:helix-turn-helix domain-containing protein [bacterium]